VALGELQGVLLDLALTGHDKASAIAEAARILTDYTNSLAAVYFERNEQVRWQPFDGRALRELNTTFGLDDDRWRTWCDQAAAEGRLQHYLVEGALPMTVIAVPVAVPDGKPEVLCAAFRTAKKPAHGVVILMQNVAAHLTMWFLRRGYKWLDQESDDLAALIELVAKIEDAHSLPHAAFIAANQLQNYLNCKRVALGLIKGDQHQCHLQALSGVSRFDKRSAYVLSVEAALDEAILRNDVTVWSEAHDNDPHAAKAHQGLCSEADCTCVISAPLRTVDDRIVGAWLLMDDGQLAESTTIESLLRAGSRTVASSLALVDEARCGLLRRMSRSLYGHLRSKWLKATLIASVVLAAVMCLPLRYKLKCDATVEPVTRRFVAAPFESTLEKTLVKPGDLVDEGATLALLDGRELRMELAGLEAELKQASKQRDTAMAARKTAEAQIARLEMENLELKIRVLRHRSEQLRIESPTDGIVVSGDLERVEGAPLKVGQTMFEIAPLNNMIVEVAVPESEIGHVRNEMEVHAKIEAYPGHTWSGKINRIHPRSEIREQESVFVAEVELQDSAGLLRPGMHGEARIMADRRAWGWILFHRAWHSLQFKLGW
jgi:biotin carboxyl carrier protein